MWLYSKPQNISGGWVQVPGDGVVKLTLPKDAGNGQHKLSVQNASNGVIGWTTLKVKAATPHTGIPVIDWLLDLLDRIFGWF